MAQKLIGNLPGDFDLTTSFQIVVTAVDPATGATVSGVKVSNIAIMAEPLTPDTTTVDTGPDYSPLFIPLLEQPPGG